MHIGGCDDKGEHLHFKRFVREKTVEIGKAKEGSVVSRVDLQAHISPRLAVLVSSLPGGNVQLLTDQTHDCHDIDRCLAGFRLSGKAVEIIRGVNFGKCIKSACPSGIDCSVSMD